MEQPSENFNWFHDIYYTVVGLSPSYQTERRRREKMIGSFKLKRTNQRKLRRKVGEVSSFLPFKSL